MKNEVNPWIWNPKNVGRGLEGLGYNVLKRPAIKLEAAPDKNQIPIIKHENLTGDNLETIDNPIGEIHNSAIVIIKYIPIK